MRLIMEIFCKKCGNVQSKTPDDLIGEFCVCEYCDALFTWYKKKEDNTNKPLDKESRIRGKN